MLRISGFLLAVAMCLAAPAMAEDIAVVAISLKDHVFTPSDIHVVSRKPVFLEITNNDPTPEEFDSGILGIEKVIPGGGKARIRLRPLIEGSYKFIGEYHDQTAHGTIIAEPGS
jgi:hypothetical protein